MAERQYLIFNLLAGGKLAWDNGDFATAATKWEALLRVHGPGRGGREGDPTAGARGAQPRRWASPSAAPPVAATPPESPAPAAPRRRRARRAPRSPFGQRYGLGRRRSGSGRRRHLARNAVGGETPRPAPARGKVITQRNKTFIPRVLAVTVGSKVSFRNEDAIFHNVFSLSKPNDFDTGLYKQGATYTQTFQRAGVVQILCNIHSSMLGFVYVVDSPYYAQADSAGAFTIKGVPPGDYELKVWHEAASKTVEQRLSVGANGARGVALQVAGDKRAPQFVPDKSGKPRQSHLGY